MLQLTDHASDAIRNLLDLPSLPHHAGLRIVRTDAERGDLSLDAKVEVNGPVRFRASAQP